MSLKGLEHVIRQNSMTQLLDELMADPAARQWLAGYLNSLGNAPLDLPNLISSYNTTAGNVLDWNNREDLAYSLDKMIGTGTLPGQSGAHISNPYWNYLPVEERLETLKEALIAITTLNMPTQTFWLTLDDRKDPVDKGFMFSFFGRSPKHAPDIGFRVQITKNPHVTIVHIITPYPSGGSGRAGGILNTQLDSWVIGAHRVVQAQAEKMNDTNQDARDLARWAPGLAPPPAGRYDATPLGQAGPPRVDQPAVSQVQLRFYDPTNPNPIDYNNDPIN